MAAATSAAQAAAASARAAIAAARPAANTRSRRVSGLPQPTDVTMQRASTRPLERAMAAQQRRCNKNRNKRKVRTMSKQIARMEDEVYQAMAVMDASTGKMLNYRQLRRDPKYKIQWDKSAANEFGRLADGVGNRVKGTKTIEFIRKCDVPQSRMKDVTYGSFVCNVRNKKNRKEQNQV